MGSEIQGIEARSFDWVPEDERHGKSSQVFYMWFGISASIFSLVTGFIGISLGLSFWWSLVAVVLGNTMGAFFMALHAAQGPTLGLPQMIQSRAQFGYYGTVLPLVITWVMYVAFYAVDVVLAGQGFQVVFGWTLDGWMAVLTVPTLLIAIFGYDIINRAYKYQTLVFIPLFVLVTVVAFIHGAHGHSPSSGTFKLGTFLLATSSVAAYQITYAPYVSDYTRYLPPSAVKRAFTLTYVATVTSCVWLMALGAYLGLVDPKMASMLAELKDLGGSLGGPLTIVLALGLIAPNASAIYGGTIITMTIGNNLSDKLQSTARLRAIIATFLAALGLFAAIAGSASFMTNLENFLTIILYILIPWSVINLTDYYVVHHGHFKIADFYDKNGPFGKLNVPALVIYAIAIAIEVPFMSTSFFEGPVAKALNGGDISWIVGGVVTIPLYLIGRRFMGPPSIDAAGIEDPAAETIAAA